MNASEDLTTTKMNTDAGDVYVYVVARFSLSDFSISADEAMKVFYAYDYDHPGYYWISNTLWYSNTAIFLSTEQEFATVSERTRLNNLISNGVEEYIALAENGADDLDKISIVHDLIVDAVDYAHKEGTTIAESAKWAHSVVGVFDEQKHVVCEGYADTFSLIMNCMKIPNYYIVGTAGSGGSGGGGEHAWNAVSTDNGTTYMYADLTWDDLGGSNGYYYRWLGTPKTEFEQTHNRYRSYGVGSKWLYDISGNISENFEDTYYCRANLYFDGTDSVSEKAQTGRTRAARIGSCLTYLATADSSVKSSIVSLMGYPKTYWLVSYEGTEYHVYSRAIEDSEISVEQAALTGVDNEYVYTGSAVEPEPTVTLDGIKLIKGRDYTVSYDNNSAVTDNASVSVTGTGKFKSTASKSFAISGHVFSDEWTSDDDYHWHACKEANCDEKVSYAEHQWVEKTTRQPSYTQEGEKTYTCSVCGKKKTEVIPKLTPAPSPSPSVTAPAAPAEIGDLPAVKISKPKAAKGKITVKWKKPSKKNLKKIQGIEIKVTGPTGEINTTAGKKKTSKKVGGLMSKQRYTVQVRAYAYINGAKHVSAWKSKSVKVK